MRDVRSFVGVLCCNSLMPRKRDLNAPPVVYRTARCGLRVTRAQRNRCFGLLRSAGDVWCAVLELNSWRRRRRDIPLAGYRELCRELAASGPGTFGELDSAATPTPGSPPRNDARPGMRRRGSRGAGGAWSRSAGMRARSPWTRRVLKPAWRRKGCPPLLVRLDRDIPYPAAEVRSVTLGFDAGRLYLDVTAEVPVTTYPDGARPDPALVAGVDLGIIHPYAVAGPGGQGLLVSGRAIRAEHRQHLRDRKGRTRAAARRAPKPGQRGSRRWRQHCSAGSATAGARHRRRGPARPSTRPAARPGCVLGGGTPGGDAGGRRPARRP